MSTITTASRQWVARPSDERFTSLIDLDAHCQNLRDRSAARVMTNRSLQAVPVAGDHEALRIEGPNGAAVVPTNWAFGQLAQRAGAPAGYLRELPALSSLGVFLWFRH
jgi:hypothetical protein